MKNINILIGSLGKGGGCSQYMFEIIKHFNENYVLYQSIYAYEDLQDSSIKIKTYRNKLEFIINTLFIFPLLFFKILFSVKKYDVLFLPYFHFWNLAFSLPFRLFKKPVVVIEHDGIIHSGEELPFQQLLTKLNMLFATKIIFLTHFVKEQINVKYPKLLLSKEIYVIPHGIYNFQGINTKQKQYSSKPIILFFGRVNPYKGIEKLLKAISMLDKDMFEKLIIAGKSSYKYNIGNVDKNKIEIVDRFLEKYEIAKYFNQSHILVLPYKEATQSGVIALGIANAIPMICMNVGGLKEQLTLESYSGMEENAICSLLCDNEADIYMNIKKLIEDKELYLSFSYRLTLRAKELEWLTISQRILKVLKN